MQGLTIHDTETEEAIGTVYPIETIDFYKFEEEVRRTWVLFNQEPENVEDYSIEDFIDFHNTVSNLEIDYIVMDFIQL